MNPALAFGGIIARASFNSKTDIMTNDIEVWKAHFYGAWLSMGVPLGAAIVAGYVYKGSVGDGLDFSLVKKCVGKLICCSKDCCKRADKAKDGEEGALEMERLSNGDSAGNGNGTVVSRGNSGIGEITGQNESSPMRNPRTSV